MFLLECGAAFPGLLALLSNIHETQFCTPSPPTWLPHGHVPFCSQPPLNVGRRGDQGGVWQACACFWRLQGSLAVLVAALESREHEAPSLVSPTVFRTEEPASSRGVETAGRRREPEPNPTCQEELCWVNAPSRGLGLGRAQCGDTGSHLAERKSRP